MAESPLLDHTEYRFNSGLAAYLREDSQAVTQVGGIGEFLISDDEGNGGQADFAGLTILASAQKSSSKIAMNPADQGTPLIEILGILPQYYKIRVDWYDMPPTLGDSYVIDRDSMVVSKFRPQASIPTIKSRRKLGTFVGYIPKTNSNGEPKIWARSHQKLIPLVGNGEYPAALVKVENSDARATAVAENIKLLKAPLSSSSIIYDFSRKNRGKNPYPLIKIEGQEGEYFRVSVRLYSNQEDYLCNDTATPQKKLTGYIKLRNENGIHSLWYEDLNLANRDECFC